MTRVIYSMTGYGKGDSYLDLMAVTIELRSVNHRYLDLAIRLPRALNVFEDGIRKQIAAKISRGHIDVYLNYEDKRQGNFKLVVNENLVRALQAEIEKLEDMGLEGNMGVAEVLNFREVVQLELQESDSEVVAKLIEDALNIALKQLIQMKATEGRQLVANLLEKVEGIEGGLKEIAKRHPETIEAYKEKLTTRIEETLAGYEIDYPRLLQEIAINTDKICVDEEITRLAAHLKHYRAILEKGGVVGKSLDFLTQEAYREVNTIGSKASDTFITENVLEMKNILEQMREQIQNIE